MQYENKKKIFENGFWPWFLVALVGAIIVLGFLANHALASTSNYFNSWTYGGYTFSGSIDTNGAFECTSSPIELVVTFYNDVAGTHSIRGQTCNQGATPWHFPGNRLAEPGEGWACGYDSVCKMTGGYYKVTGVDTMEFGVSVDDFTPPTYDPTITMSFPAGTSTTYADFTYWYVSTLYSSVGDTLRVYYTNTDGYDNNLYSDSEILIQTSTPTKIKKNTPLWWYGLATSTHWYVYPEIVHNNIAYAGVGAIYTINNLTGSTSTTSSTPNTFYPASYNLPSFENPFSTSTFSGEYNVYFATTTCGEIDLNPFTDTYGSSTFDGIVCRVQNGAINTINWIIGAFNTVKDKIVQALLGIKNIFPISIVTAINDDIQQAQATSTDVTLILSGTGQIFGGRSFTIFSSSTTEKLETDAGFDYKTFVDYILYAGTGLIMLLGSILVIRSLKNKDSI